LAWTGHKTISQKWRSVVPAWQKGQLSNPAVSLRLFPSNPNTLQTASLMGCRHSGYETPALPGIGAIIGLVRRVDRLLENVEKAQLGLEALEKRTSAVERPHDRA
jgi:hypothetical protein